MRLYRKDGKDIAWVGPRSRDIIWGMLVTPLFSGMLGYFITGMLFPVFIGLAIFCLYLVLAILLLIGFDLLYERYRKNYRNIKGDGI